MIHFDEFSRRVNSCIDHNDNLRDCFYINPPMSLLRNWPVGVRTITNNEPYFMNCYENINIGDFLVVFDIYDDPSEFIHYFKEDINNNSYYNTDSKAKSKSYVSESFIIVVNSLNKLEELLKKYNFFVWNTYNDKHTINKLTIFLKTMEQYKIEKFYEKVKFPIVYNSSNTSIKDPCFKMSLNLLMNSKTKHTIYEKFIENSYFAKTFECYEQLKNIIKKSAGYNNSTITWHEDIDDISSLNKKENFLLLMVSDLIKTNILYITINISINSFYYDSYIDIDDD